MKRLRGRDSRKEKARGAGEVEPKEEENKICQCLISRSARVHVLVNK